MAFVTSFKPRMLMVLVHMFLTSWQVGIQNTILLCLFFREHHKCIAHIVKQ